MKAVKCPVCEGSGKYGDVRCHGYDGKGWVAVPMFGPVYGYLSPPLYPHDLHPFIPRNPPPPRGTQI